MKRCSIVVLSLIAVALSSARAADLTPPPQDFAWRGYGNDALYSTGEISLPAQVTVEGWVWLRSATRASLLFVPSQEGPPSLRLGLDEGRAAVELWTASEDYFGFSDDQPLELEAWHHLALARGDDGLKLAVDGEWVGAGSPEAGAPDPSATVFNVGEELDGVLRQLRVWNAALDIDEIRGAAETAGAIDSRIVSAWPLDDRSRGRRFTREVLDIAGEQDLERPWQQNGGRWVPTDDLEMAFRLRGHGTERAPLGGMALLDVDGDDDIDVYRVHRIPDQSITSVEHPHYEGEAPFPDELYLNDGSGGFTLADTELSGPAVQGYLTHVLFSADFTGDGIEDVLVVENGLETPTVEGEGVITGSPNSLLVGTGAGLANESAQRVPQILDWSHRGAIGDIDGDGDLDFFSATLNQTPGPMTFYVNQGGGFFETDAERIPAHIPLTILPTSVSLIDADLDGLPELVLGEIGNFDDNVLLRNRGDGYFVEHPEVTLPTKLIRGDDDEEAVRPGTVVHIATPTDLDGDGILDLLLGEHHGEDERPGDPWREPRLQILLGNGDGSFRDASDRLSQDWGQSPDGDVTAIFHLDVADVDGNGWNDIVIPGAGGASLFLNRGRGRFEDFSHHLPVSGDYASMMAADVDGDGDIDLVAESSGFPWPGASFDVFEAIRPLPTMGLDPEVDLALDLAVDSGAFLDHGRLRIIATVSNPAAQAVEGVEMVLASPAGFDWVDTRPQAGGCTQARRASVCALGTLAAQSEISVELDAVVAPRHQPRRGFFASGGVTGSTRDPDPSNNHQRLELSVIEADADGDGIPDWAELRYGFDPRVADLGDADGDGVDNGEEIETATDPSRSDRPPASQASLLFQTGNAEAVLEADASSALDLDETFTLEMWLKPRSAVTGFVFFSSHIGLSIEGDRQLHAFLRDDESGLNTGITTGPVELGAWHHVAVVADGKIFWIVVDGVTASRGPHPGVDPGPIFGAAVGVVGFSESMDAELWQLRIWDRALTPEELAERGPARPERLDGLLVDLPLDDGSGSELRQRGPLAMSARVDGGGSPPSWVAETPRSAPVSSWRMRGLALCPGEEIQFFDTSTGPIDSWNWDFGDGSSATLRDPQHSFAAAGQYRVRLETSNSLGSSSVERLLSVDCIEDFRPVLAVPGLARTAGAAGSFFVSTLWLSNPSAESMPLQLSYAPAGAATASTTAITLAANEDRQIDDVLATLFGADGNTFGQITVWAQGEDELPRVSARTFNQADSGTFGQYIVAEATASRRGFETGELRLSGLQQGNGRRSNVGVANLGPVSVSTTFELFDAAGAAIGSPVQRTIPARSMIQISSIAHATTGTDQSLFGVRINADGPVAGYASKLDNGTSDPIYQAAGQRAATRQWIDGVASASGAAGTFFRSELAITNEAAQASEVSLRYTPRGETTPASIRTLGLEAGASIFYDDVLEELFGLDAAVGSLDILGGPVTAWARTYNDGSELGTFGQFIPGQALGELVDSEGGLLMGLAENPSFRTNAGFLNPGSEAIEIVIEGLDGARREIDIDAGQAIFVSRVLNTLGLGGRSGVALRVRVRGQGYLLAWASVVDNGSGDATFVRPIR